MKITSLMSNDRAGKGTKTKDLPSRGHDLKPSLLSLQMKQSE